MHGKIDNAGSQPPFYDEVRQHVIYKHLGKEESFNANWIKNTLQYILLLQWIHLYLAICIAVSASRQILRYIPVRTAEITGAVWEDA